jgi:uncharacterized membrane protein
VLDRIDTSTTVLNLVYLGFIAFLPYPTRVLGLYGNEPASVVLYAPTVASVLPIAALMRVHAGHYEFGHHRSIASLADTRFSNTSL